MYSCENRNEYLQTFKKKNKAKRTTQTDTYRGIHREVSDSQRWGEAV